MRLAGNRWGLGILAGVGILALTGCTEREGPVFGNARHEPWIPIVVPDTGSMNAERFGDQTYPVFWSSAPPQTVTAPITTSTRLSSMSVGYPTYDQGLVSRYQATIDDGRALPAIPYQRVDARYFRRTVDYVTNERPGTIVVDRADNFLYLVQPGGKAIRYGVGLGRQGVSWSGRGVIRYKKKWPHWTPTDSMVEGNNDLRNFSAERGGMVAGTYNPLGARALYIFRNGEDTLYRVHGTPDWQSIGKKTSSGCVRMFNQDVIDLYSRVKDGAEIVVL